ncbi:class I SAM-dependent methyltransferase [Ectothiorhodospira variabilis]|uniref:class I SAM-dependent methyltransferase n=1 Tax=Ectothiorhodospira variabilis TaxID=505694 RepID=UPI001EFAC54B|nr:SAM-dependent methyltransferase [Ectothiorhodospira variabilis]MCG5493352.1 SAM-dependent methyltransferase [Ectothiorhodospira variabilis]MCG5502681.1 SAM-dependent methyltransferase [Ectothiorhodospira variabilis]MCG5505553.1 SAM-dependent methyltransferase [Ectothiorhodospira variabilis]
MPTDSPLPTPEPEALQVSQQLLELVRQEINAGNGWLSFRRYMELALYAPGLGYYTAGSHKLGRGGDFITAPEVSPLFGRCIARQCAQVLEGLGGGDILEFGAGTGILAVEILTTLEALDTLPERYLILELSPDLRQRQQAAVADLPETLRHRVQWLDALPESGCFQGVMLGNEVLDAMPVQVFHWQDGEVLERGVVLGERLEWADRPADETLTSTVRALHESTGGAWPSGYVSEINPGLSPWMRAAANSLAAGVIILVDYGYPRREYYSPERYRGTLIAHYRHRALDEPLVWPGVVDITANVDFTAVAEAGEAAGLSLLGYTSQAWFLMGSGLESAFQACQAQGLREQMDLAAQVRMLTLPGEMGERFQAMALGRGVSGPLMGFSGRDLIPRL